MTAAADSTHNYDTVKDVNEIMLKTRATGAGTNCVGGR